MPTATARETADPDLLRNIVEGYFAELRETENQSEAILECANRFCELQAVTAAEFERLERTGSAADKTIRRVRFGVRILNESGITTAVDESMVEAGERRVGAYTRYLPLLGSFNNCRAAACAVDPEDPKTVERFVIALLAFGIEVGFWYTGTPYVMAWRGTRFVANRTFLRLAQKGCAGCVALAMSEIHWGIRASVYNADELLSERAYIQQELVELREFAHETGYDLPTDFVTAEMNAYLEMAEDSIRAGSGSAEVPAESTRFVDQLRSKLQFEFDLPDLLRLLR